MLFRSPHVSPPRLLTSSSPYLLTSSSPHLPASSRLTSSPPYLLISSSPHLLTASSHHLLTSSYPLLLISSSPQLLISSPPHLLTCLLFASSPFSHFFKSFFLFLPPPSASPSPSEGGTSIKMTHYLRRDSLVTDCSSAAHLQLKNRPEERRVGKECRSRWWP